MACLNPVTGCIRKAQYGKSSYYYQCQAPGDIALPQNPIPTTWPQLETNSEASLALMTVIPGIAAVIVIICTIIVLGIGGWTLVKYIKLLRRRSVELKELQAKQLIFTEKAMRMGSVDPGQRKPTITSADAEVQTDFYMDAMAGPGESTFGGGVGSESGRTVSAGSIDSGMGDLEDEDEEEPDILTGRKRKKNVQRGPRHHHRPQQQYRGVAYILHRVREGVLGKQSHRRGSEGGTEKPATTEDKTEGQKDS